MVLLENICLKGELAQRFLIKKKNFDMREFTLSEVGTISGRYLITPEFSTSLGLVGVIATILTATGFIIGMTGINLALGLNEALVIATPPPFKL